jgi:LysM repeat protein
MEDMMSAIAWGPAGTGRVGPVPGRPRLTVIEGGAGAAAADGGLRITRRGRLLLLLLAAAVVVATAVLPGLRAGAAEPGHTVTVQSGQTLSEIAAAELPGMSISQGIVAIQLANELSTAQVGAGQELVIPRS